jgi:hypothetical protein
MRHGVNISSTGGKNDVHFLWGDILRRPANLAGNALAVIVILQADLLILMVAPNYRVARKRLQRGVVAQSNRRAVCSNNPEIDSTI